MSGFLFLNKWKVLEKKVTKRNDHTKESWFTDSKLGCIWPVLSKGKNL